MNVRIKCTYSTPKGTEAVFYSEEMQAKKALLLAEDLEKTGRMKNVLFIDHTDYHWNMKEIRKQLEEIQTEPHEVSVFFDGGFDLKTKKSGLGCAIYYEQNGKAYRLRKNAIVDELQSNNEAEYAALHLGLQEIENLGVHRMIVTFAGDSRVVIHQLDGEWPCYEAELSSWADRIEEKMKRLGIDPEYEIVPRKQNREADQLATQALKGVEIESVVERL
ncbi:reverse transcriptase-like protein [Virgibacillus siamensis]|uniref:reverse transcriptase-like protein n=1 Tax=Virgibacillus siamensis TaxID=480071 RepID=UPI00098636BF|nr:reverse transcriptase-like protein [Virgibacillus siamensis]